MGKFGSFNDPEKKKVLFLSKTNKMGSMMMMKHDLEEKIVYVQDKADEKRVDKQISNIVRKSTTTKLPK